MCVIAISRSGDRQPTTEELKAMWSHNSDGAGFMYARAGAVHIHKGFLSWRDFMTGLRAAHITRHDSVVYHFRISTQAGKTAAMTHPFPLTSNLSSCEALDLVCPVGIAHNGIISITTDPCETRYSDTALFITKYMSELIKCKSDIKNPDIQNTIEILGGWSKFAIMTGDGDITTIGKFYSQPGNLLVSNEFYKPVRNFSGWSYNYFNDLHAEV